MRHLSFYRFFPLPDLVSWRNRLKLEAEGLLGTILIAQEGINGMVSGEESQIARFREFLRENFSLEFKEHEAPKHAFTRLLVKIKKEIISVGDPDLDPGQATGKRLAPADLKAWLDEGRDFLLLDTRNGYEVEVGTFKGAKDLGLGSSREFLAKAIRQGVPEKTVVTFCTGGIRCEKASAALLKLGWKDVYQLEGGILGYFEAIGGAHFEGHCFVFDWRMAVDGSLKPVSRGEEGRSFGRHLLSRKL